MPERSAEEIQGEIERARVQLAGAVDQLATRVSPKRAVDDVKTKITEFATSPAGKAVAGVVGGLVLVVVIRKIRAR